MASYRGLWYMFWRHSSLRVSVFWSLIFCETMLLRLLFSDWMVCFVYFCTAGRSAVHFGKMGEKKWTCLWKCLWHASYYLFIYFSLYRLLEPRGECSMYTREKWPGSKTIKYVKDYTWIVLYMHQMIQSTQAVCFWFYVHVDPPTAAGTPYSLSCHWTKKERAEKSGARRGRMKETRRGEWRRRPNLI